MAVVLHSFSIETMGSLSIEWAFKEATKRAEKWLDDNTIRIDFSVRVVQGPIDFRVYKKRYLDHDIVYHHHFDIMPG